MSEVNPFVVIDFLEEARGRVTEQFKDKPVIDKYLQLMLKSNTELQEAIRQLMQERSIDTAIGYQLDVLGMLVGQDRTLVNLDIFDFFGFKGVPNAGSFGTILDPSVGEVFWSVDNPRFGNIKLSDDMYRLFIKAKISKNTTRATPQEIMKFSDFIFETTGSNIQYEGGAAYTLMVGKTLSASERSLLRYKDKGNSYTSGMMPKPVGVRVNYGNFDSNNFFGFKGYPGAKGFGTYNYASYDGSYTYDGSITFGPQLLPGVGGTFATLLDL